jgi:hypothetical protein
MTDLSIAPLRGQNPRGARIEYFDEIETARALAENERDKWDLVSIYRRIREGRLATIEQYHNGRNYPVTNSQQ